MVLYIYVKTTKVYKLKKHLSRHTQSIDYCPHSEMKYAPYKNGYINI
jgi:hypothetical protein